MLQGRQWDSQIKPIARSVNMDYSTNLNSKSFAKTVKFLLNEFNIEEVIETGTYDGRGSTYIFARTGIPITTIECNDNYQTKAKSFLSAYDNITFIHGLSLNKADMGKFLKDDTFIFPEWVKQDASASDSKDFYLNEIMHDVPENLLFDLINNDKKQLIYLDSAGGIGYLEFLEVLKLDKEKLKNKLLVMDDVMHIKHYRSIVDLADMENPTFFDFEGRFAWYKF